MPHVLLNADDNGQRRTILVTNNEVSENTAHRLNKVGLFQGDDEFELRGIFEQVTRPRCFAVTTGFRPDGEQITGKHADGRKFALGFPENIEFFRLDYLDPDDVDLGIQTNAILPALWLAAGAIGPRETIVQGVDFSMPVGSTYAVLFKEARFRPFKQALGTRPDITHVWFVTDSDEAYAEMRSALPSHLKTFMLYRDYLRYFRTNRERNL